LTVWLEFAIIDTYSSNKEHTVNKIKFVLEVTLIPVYFLLLLTANIKHAVFDTVSDVLDAYRGTKYKYGIK
jgi:hypothetical protein